MNHLGDTADDHVADRWRPVALHNVFKGSKEVFLEAKVGELSLLDKLHGQLAKGIDSKEGDVLITSGAHLVEMVTCPVVKDNTLKFLKVAQ